MNYNKNIFIFFVCIVIFLISFSLFLKKKNLKNSTQAITSQSLLSESSTIAPSLPAKRYSVKEFPFVMGPKKLSTKQIRDHKELYAGYVNKRNEVEESLLTVDKSKSNSTYSHFRSLKVSEVFARNAAVLHELYFENIGAGTTIGQVTQEFIIRDFGSLEAFKQDLMATAIAARGWAITCFNLDDQRLQNYLMDSHYEKVPILTIPILVIDIYEHAYMIDFGINRKEYLALLWDNINWDVVEERLKLCIFAS